MNKTSRPGSLYRLIYCSRNAIGQGASPDTMQQEVRAILCASRRNNELDNITGALLFTTSGFAQVLEGPRDVVERTFERISGDPRHADVTVLSFTPTERRSFPDWSMGCSGQMSAFTPDPLVPLLADTHSAGPRATTGSDVLHLLEKVVQREDEWVPA
ncbi:BLUF domain-containing protein [Rhodopila sp.]|uniref:BLUF domain-containing protein n=1 Tax=Rhodopila sp. TaxID=2480087 RepID=UPI003D11B544